MIFGIGTDIVEIARIEQAVARHGERFAERILAAEEYQHYLEHGRSAGFLAKRFAAKEAAAKAFGTGFTQGLSLHHIVVSNDTLGKPELNFTGYASELCEHYGISASFLSLADEKHYALAYVTLWSEV